MQTSFSEETLFRGLLLKRVAARFGFWTGNLVQGVGFGLVHSLLYLTVFGVGLAVGVGVFTAALGMVVGFINERLAGGSLVASWCGHGGSNLLVGLLALSGLWV